MHGNITVAIDNLHTLLAVYNLDEVLTGQAALDAIAACRKKQNEDNKKASVLCGIDPNVVAALVTAMNIQTDNMKSAISEGIVAATKAINPQVKEIEIQKAVAAVLHLD
jgi:hypothetical protein